MESPVLLAVGQLVLGHLFLSCCSDSYGLVPRSVVSREGERVQGTCAPGGIWVVTDTLGSLCPFLLPRSMEVVEGFLLDVLLLWDNCERIAFQKAWSHSQFFKVVLMESSGDSLSSSPWE